MAKGRYDFTSIARWVPPQSTVLDLGCGDGSLLVYLKNHRDIFGYGVEKDSQNWLYAMQKGISVLQMNLEEGLSNFSNKSFDTVILSQTLQAMHHTENILREMLRVGHSAIVTFPNFGYWQHRIQLLQGRMPVSRHLPHAWHNTPNIHLCTLSDFEDLCLQSNIVIQECLVMTGNKSVRFMPNLLGSLALYWLR